MLLRVLKYAGLALLLGLVGLVVSSCTMLGLNYASLETSGKPVPSPQIEARSLADWQAQRETLKAQFEETLYGPWPEGLAVTLLSRRIADSGFAGGRARLEDLHIQLGEGEGASDFYLGLAVPTSIPPGGLGLIIGQTFSSNCGVFTSLALTQANGEPCDSTDVPWIVEYIFGEYIAQVPFDDVFDAGFAYASFYASDLVPDSASRAGPVLERLVAPSGASPTGTLMAWAYGYSAAIDLLQGEAWLDTDRIAAFGHSRHGKSALLVGIWDRRIDMVLSHQSGFGGAALSRSQTGERLDRVQATYPHWFDPGLAAYTATPETLPVDQHQLLALLAPTPVFLGNGRRDVWSDPNSTFRAAQAASDIYRLHGARGAAGDAMTRYDPEADLAYFLRPGGHGTDRRDMDAILAFLTARRQPTPLAPVQQAAEWGSHKGRACQHIGNPLKGGKHAGRLRMGSIAEWTAFVGQALAAREMELQAFLLPVLALAAWTMVMWIWMYITRIPAMQKARLDPNDARHPGTYGDRLPSNVRAVADNYNHLHEAPTVFYAVMGFAALTGGADTIADYIAWAYVGLRVVHSFVQVLSPVVVFRFAVFALSSFALMALVAKELLRVFL